jgi:hypothetical protein
MLHAPHDFADAMGWIAEANAAGPIPSGSEAFDVRSSSATCATGSRPPGCSTSSKDTPTKKKPRSTPRSSSPQGRRHNDADVVHPLDRHVLERRDPDGSKLWRLIVGPRGCRLLLTRGSRLAQSA